MAVGSQARGRDRTYVAQSEYGYLHLASWQNAALPSLLEPGETR